MTEKDSVLRWKVNCLLITLGCILLLVGVDIILFQAYVNGGVVLLTTKHTEEFPLIEFSFGVAALLLVVVVAISLILDIRRKKHG